MVVGPVFLVSREEFAVAERDIPEAEVPAEIARFEDAVIQTRRQIRQIQDGLRRAIGASHANILDVHMMVLDDRTFAEEILQGIEGRRKNAEAMVRGVTQKYASVLSTVEDEYLRERVADVKDVAKRLLHNLAGTHGSLSEGLKSKSLVVAADLAPSETAVLRRELVLGFATFMGSPASHTAIMARALKIPAVVGLGDVGASISAGDEVLIDGNKGLLIVNPSAARMERYGRVLEARESIRTGLVHLKDQPAETRDGHRIMLSANIELVPEVAEVLRQGAEGVGLFRSEYLYLSRRDLPSEDEQAAAYGEVAQRLAPAPVIIRTIDLGGDKFAPHLMMAEVNPFMGFRAIRFCLAQPEIFRAQLRAILRASVHGNVKLMYPMVTDVSEVQKANELLEQAKVELRSQGTPFDEGLEVGAMIETPSAALTSDVIAQHVRFFSLGTNDLVQYTLAVDRVNDRVAHLYQPTHPAVLRLIDRTIRAGHERGLWVGVCGEMAGNPVLAPLLVGLGADELSMAPGLVPMVKDAVRSVHHAEVKELARMAMEASSGVEVLTHCRELTRRAAPEILELVE